MDKLSNQLNDLSMQDQEMILVKQDSVQSNGQEQEEFIDDEKLAECQQEDSDYLTKENLINLLKTYKALLSEQQKQKTIAKSTKRAFYVEQEDSVDLMESESSYESTKNLCLNLSDDEQEISDSNTNLILNELKSILYKSSISKESFFHDTDEEEHDDELPNNLIVTQLPNELFHDQNVICEFERIFLQIDLNCKFCYFRIFKRCLIQYNDPLSAILARFELDDYFFMNDRLRIFLTKVNVLN